MSEKHVKPSVSRTYIAVLHDLVCPDEVRFVKFILPDSFGNSVKEALYFYRSTQEDRAEQIDDIISFEEFNEAITSMVDDYIVDHVVEYTKKEKNKFKKNESNSIVEDMKAVRMMLDAWNDEQIFPSTTYAMIVRALLSKLSSQDKTIRDIKNVINIYDQKI